MQKLEDTIANYLLAKGWTIDLTVKEDGYGPLKNYVDYEPTLIFKNDRHSFYDALHIEMGREDDDKYEEDEEDD